MINLSIVKSLRFDKERHWSLGTSGVRPSSYVPGIEWWGTSRCLDFLCVGSHVRRVGLWWCHFPWLGLWLTDWRVGMFFVAATLVAHCWTSRFSCPVWGPPWLSCSCQHSYFPVLLKFLSVSLQGSNSGCASASMGFWILSIGVGCSSGLFGWGALPQIVCYLLWGCVGSGLVWAHFFLWGVLVVSVVAGPALELFR